MPDSRTQEKIVRLLLDAAGALRERGDESRAGALLEEAYRLSQEESQGTTLKAAVRASQGVLDRMRGDLDNAIHHLMEAIELRRGAADSLGVARALSDLGLVHLEAGRNEEAERSFREAMDLTSQMEPGRTRAEVLEHGAIIHQRQADTDRARTLFQQALDVYEVIGDAAASARVHSEIEHLRPNGHGPGLDEELNALERNRLIDALEAEQWNQSRAARRLGVTETRVRNLMRRHGLRSRNRRGRPRKAVGEPMPR
jgi:tetratricopeptide (TPR) repeat protein